MPRSGPYPNSSRSPCCRAESTLVELVSPGQPSRAQVHRGVGEPSATQYAEHACRRCGAHWRSSWRTEPADGYGVRVVMGPPLARGRAPR